MSMADVMKDITARRKSDPPAVAAVAAPSTKSRELEDASDTDEDEDLEDLSTDEDDGDEEADDLDGEATAAKPQASAPTPQLCDITSLCQMTASSKTGPAQILLDESNSTNWESSGSFPHQVAWRPIFVVVLSLFFLSFFFFSLRWVFIA
jgi:hypothetical protein